MVMSKVWESAFIAKAGKKGAQNQHWWFPEWLKRMGCGGWGRQDSPVQRILKGVYFSLPTAF